MQYAKALDNEPAGITCQLDMFGAPRQAMMLADHAGEAVKGTLIDVEQARLQQSIRRAIESGQIELSLEDEEGERTMGTVYRTTCECLVSIPEPEPCEFSHVDEYERSHDTWANQWQEAAAAHEARCPRSPWYEGVTED